MSSDSDSDVCDFTSDISKISKGFHQFWEDFSNKASEKEKTSVLCTDAPNNISSLNESTSLVLNTKPKADIKSECVQVDTNIHNRITNKLNELTAEIHTILYDKYKQKRPTKGRKAKRWQGLSKNTRRPNRRNTSLSAASVSNVIPDSYDEVPHTVNAIKEELNPIVSINILWKSVEKHCFKVHKYQTLSCISEHYCEKFNVNPKLLFFTLDDRYINLDETSFVSLRLNENKQIEGGVLPEKYLENSQEYTNLQCIEPLKFKVQYRDRKNKEIIVSCQRSDKMEIIFWKVSRSIEQPVENIRLYFDGCIINPSNNIFEMDLEEGDCFDLDIINA